MVDGLHVIMSNVWNKGLDTGSVTTVSVSIEISLAGVRAAGGNKIFFFHSHCEYSKAEENLEVVDSLSSIKTLRWCCLLHGLCFFRCHMIRSTLVADKLNTVGFYHLSPRNPTQHWFSRIPLTVKLLQFRIKE